jgi:hypothetical protein
MDASQPKPGCPSVAVEVCRVVGSSVAVRVLVCDVVDVGLVVGVLVEAAGGFDESIWSRLTFSDLKFSGSNDWSASLPPPLSSSVVLAAAGDGGDLGRAAVGDLDGVARLLPVEVVLGVELRVAGRGVLAEGNRRERAVDDGVGHDLPAVRRHLAYPVVREPPPAAVVADSRRRHAGAARDALGLVRSLVRLRVVLGRAVVVREHEQAGRRLACGRATECDAPEADSGRARGRRRQERAPVGSVRCHVAPETNTESGHCYAGANRNERWFGRPWPSPSTACRLRDWQRDDDASKQTECRTARG